MKAKNLLIVFLIVVTVIENQFAQTLKIGFRYEPGILFGEQRNENFNIPLIFSISGNLLIEPWEIFNFEIRPGIVLINDEYSGYELGLFSKIKILPSQFFLLLGANHHSNIGTAHNRGGSYEKGIFYKGLGIGLILGSNSFIDLIYFWTSDRKFAYEIDMDGLTYSRIMDKEVKSIVKLGFNITWDIF
ncbi:MAG: hypothetical protein KGZ42_09655 [Melioribacter sp.]|nr:hypothetical protein [Melioribacter sp.]